jgi:hypothetical protein
MWARSTAEASREFGWAVKQPYSLLSVAEAKNKWRCTSTLLVRFRGLLNFESLPVM